MGLLAEGGRGLFPHTIATRPGPTSPKVLRLGRQRRWLEEVGGPAPMVEDAAQHLAHWQVGYDAQLDRPWMAWDELGRRLEVSHLDWGLVDVDPRAVRLLEGPVQVLRVRW